MGAYHAFVPEESSGRALRELEQPVGDAHLERHLPTAARMTRLPFMDSKRWLGALAPYLGGVVGFATSRLSDELLLGRYCLYLTTHVAGELVGGKKLLQDVVLPCIF